MEKKHDGEGGNHYKENGKKEVCIYMEQEAIRVFRNNVHEYGELKAMKMALWAACAVKHEKRAGTKDGNPSCMELKKAENYRHRQNTGEWIKND